MTTWIVGDIHGCSEELSSLIEELDLSTEDQLVACGDLFHRGPDPAGVMDLLTETGARFILGNHERAILRRLGLAPARALPAERPALRELFPPIEAEDLDGDGHMPCHMPAARRQELLIFLQRHSGYFLRGSDLERPSTTADGHSWCVVHAGFDPSKSVEANTPFELTRTRRLDRRGHPWWFECHDGPELVLYGHSVGGLPRAEYAHGQLVALGLDTGCVYGGALTAYSPELDELVGVAARVAHAA